MPRACPDLSLKPVTAVNMLNTFQYVGRTASLSLCRRSASAWNGGLRTADRAEPAAKPGVSSQLEREKEGKRPRSY